MTNSPDFEKMTPEEYEQFQKESAERIKEIEKKHWKDYEMAKLRAYAIISNLKISKIQQGLEKCRLWRISACANWYKTCFIVLEI